MPVPDPPSLPVGDVSEWHCDAVGRGTSPGRTRTWRAAGATAGLGYAAGASFTRPFTLAADVVTAVALAGAVGVAAWSIRHDGPRHLTAEGPGIGGTRWSRWWPLWSVPILGVTAWELYCFADLPRAQHPTLSSLIDSLDSSRVGKTVAFAAWLVLGWFLVTR